MIRASWKYLLIGVVVAVALSLAVPQASAARWWGCCGGCGWGGCGWGGCGWGGCGYSCYSPCYGGCGCGGCYLGVRPGPIRRAVFGPYKWYAGCGCGYGCGTCGYGCGTCGYGCGYPAYDCGCAGGTPAFAPRPVRRRLRRRSPCSISRCLRRRRPLPGCPPPAWSRPRLAWDRCPACLPRCLPPRPRPAACPPRKAACSRSGSPTTPR